MSYTALCFVAGKSGGHIIPCLTLARHAKEKNPDIQILFFSTTASLDTQILGNNTCIDTHVGLPLETVNVRKWYLLPVMCWRLMYSFFMSLYELYKKKPLKIISTGGHIAVPVCIAARFLRIPIELYELNVQPGKAIEWIAPYAHTVNICFKKTAQLLKPVICTVADYPIRFNMQECNERDSLSRIGLDATKKTIFVLGGSQGSQFLNAAIEQVVTTDTFLAQHINIIHQTGSCDQEYWRLLYARLGICAYTFAYSDTMATYYQVADLIISRAGAGALFEIRHFNKPSIIIPLETQHDAHQYANAYEMVIQNQRLFTLIRQETIIKDSNVLIEGIRKMITLKS